MNRGIALATVLMAAVGCLAQDESALQTMAPQRGIVPYGTYAIDKLENINVASGSLGYRIPIASLPKGRGGLQFGLDLLYSSDVYDVTYGSHIDDSTSPAITYYVPSLTRSYWGGWTYGFMYSLTRETANATSPCATPGPMDTTVYSFPIVNKLSIIFPDGSHHTLRPEISAAGPEDHDGYFRNDPTGAVASAACVSASGPTAVTWYTADSTYLRLTTAPGGLSGTGVPSSCSSAQFTWTLHFPDGRAVYGCDYTPWRLQDANGNGYNISAATCSITVLDCPHSSSDVTLTTTLTDDLGRTISLNHFITPTGPEYDTVVWNEVGGQTATAKVYYTTVAGHGTMAYPTELIDQYQYPQSSNEGATLYAVSSVELPVGQPYVFGYAALGGDDLTSHTSSATPCAFLDSIRNYVSGAGWGELNCVQTPAGGIVSYKYQLDGGGERQNGAVTQNPVVEKKVYQFPSPALPDTWTYSYSKFTFAQTCNHGSYCTKMAAPDQGVTEFDYYADFDTFGGRTFQTIFPDQSRSATFWAGNSLAPHGQAINSNNPFPATTSHYVASGTSVSARSMALDQNGNTTQTWEYDLLPNSGYTGVLKHTWDLTAPYTATGSGSGLIRQTTATYLSASTSFAVAAGPPFRWDLLENKYVTGGDGTAGPATAFDYDTTGNPLHEWRYADSKCSGGCQSGFISSPSAASNAIVTTRAYDGYGNLTSLTDPAGHVTTYGYDSESLYATAITYGSGARHFTAQYDHPTGLAISVSDTENQITDTYAYDIAGRVTSATRAHAGINGRLTTYFYDDTARRSVMASDLLAYNDQIVVGATTFDSLGRPYLTRQKECGSESATDDAAGIKSVHLYLYSGSNRYELESKPYRASSLCGGTQPPDSSIGWTLTKFDQMNRPVAIGTYDSGTSATNYPAPFGSGSPTLLGITSISYSDQSTTTVDPAGVSKTTTVDALGRLIQVQESGISQTTTYAYDVADNLISVQQPGLATPCAVPNSGNATRAFRYDSLGRLTSACNPESNTILWTYDDNGNPLTRTQLNSGGSTVATMTMTYNAAIDPMGRITSKTYSDSVTPPVTYTYNFSGTSGQPPCSFGALTATTTTATSSEPAVARKILGYDCIAGKETGVSQQIGSGSTYQVNHSWGPGGAPYQTAMVSTGRTLTYSYDGAGRVLGVTGTLNGVSTGYAANIQYAAHGGALSLSMGNGIVETTSYTANLAVSGIAAKYTPSGGSAQTLFGVTYGYGSGAAPNGDNGNVLSQTIVRTDGSGSKTWVQSYGYAEHSLTNALNRLTSASEPAIVTNGAWSQSFAYDNSGNRAVTSSDFSMSTEVPQALTAYGSNNRMTGGLWAYDDAGNITSFNGVTTPLRTALYDGENRMYTATQNGITETYAYDGEGRRVSKTGPVTGGGTGTTVYVYDANGELAAEYPAVAPGTGGTNYVTVDALGSTRLVTGAVNPNQAANQISCEDFLPFGEQIPAGVNGRTAACFGGGSQLAEAQFTGKERDAESGLDYFGARYLSSAQGRFTSVDPSMLSVALRNPQSWNRYSYTLNNPVRYVDPSGELWTPAGDGTYSWVDACAEGQTCHNSVAAVSKNDNALLVYGSKDSTDIQSYFANGSGNIDLREVALESHDANFELKRGAQGYLSLANAAAFFNVAENYSETYSDSAKLFVTDAGRANGAVLPPHQTHDHGRAVDLRYPDENGDPLLGPSAAAEADVARVKTLVDAAKKNGLNQNYSDRPKAFGTSYAPGHDTHLHLGSTIQRITPPNK